MYTERVSAQLQLTRPAGQGSYACISCVDRESGLPFYDSPLLAFKLGDLCADSTARLKSLAEQPAEQKAAAPKAAGCGALRIEA